MGMHVDMTAYVSSYYKSDLRNHRVKWSTTIIQVIRGIRKCMIKKIDLVWDRFSSEPFNYIFANIWNCWKAVCNYCCSSESYLAHSANLPEKLYILLGGNTTTPSGLYARLFHAFVVQNAERGLTWHFWKGYSLFKKEPRKFWRWSFIRFLKS